ncbi:MAG TPA: type II toxin-antitoxin system PemK/MazF family toxin [Actinobacteria bacterium]|nr:type II toxin-antitoxin system PemK/MazF family toxin [Actinomycetota bacterium]
MKSSSFPRHGEIWLVNFNPGRGSEQKGIRPALIIQNDVGNEHSSTTIVAAITTTIRVYPVTVFLPKGSAGLDKDSMVNLAQILTIDKARLIKRLGELDTERLAQTNQALRVSLNLEG